jgi:hypothetical protein
MDLVFHSKSGGPHWETNVLNQALYPALQALRFQESGMRAFRRGCNRGRELAGINPAIIRQQMEHSSATMTALNSGEIPQAQIRAEFSSKFGNKIVVLEKMENEAPILRRPDFLLLQASMEAFDVTVAFRMMIRRPPMRDAEPHKCLQKARGGVTYLVCHTRAAVTTFWIGKAGAVRRRVVTDGFPSSERMPFTFVKEMERADRYIKPD